MSLFLPRMTRISRKNHGNFARIREIRGQESYFRRSLLCKRLDERQKENFADTYSTEVEMDWIEITDLPVKLPRLDPAFKGFRLAQVSDFHLGQWINKERLDQIVTLTLEQSPDLIALTGDYLEYHPYGRPNVWETYAENLNVIRTSFASLPPVCPTVAILGNHDHRVNPEWVEQALTDAGVTVLTSRPWTTSSKKLAASTRF
ncbi:MAG: hypothetical protein DWB59_07460 [Anaerolineae bacterium]|nr:hypothetical protein [Anaerolineae bacterium]